MIIAVPKEIVPGERRVALVPDVVKRSVADGLDVRVERGAGEGALLPDEEFAAAGATLVSDRAALWGEADVVLKVQPPAANGAGGANELDLLREGVVLIGVLRPLVSGGLVRELARRKVTSFSLDALPRITRAQVMDVLSSMSTVTGYKAVLLAASTSGKFFPMLVTAAGTLRPARVLVLGAGVAGLQAIATARRLGGIVSAFDVRPAVKEQVESLGARFIAPEPTVQAEGAGGYAKELSEEQHRKELELIHEHVRKTDIVITTALVPGRRAPVLITEAMVQDMPSGAVIVDLAAEAGGNCALTEAGRDVVRHGVTVVGPVNLPATMPTHASQMYARNVTAFLQLLVKDGHLALNFEDEIVAGTCITHDGRVVHDAVRRTVEGGNA